MSDGYAQWLEDQLAAARSRNAGLVRALERIGARTVVAWACERGGDLRNDADVTKWKCHGCDMLYGVKPADGFCTNEGCDSAIARAALASRSLASPGRVIARDMDGFELRVPGAPILDPGIVERVLMEVWRFGECMPSIAQQETVLKAVNAARRALAAPVEGSDSHGK